MSRHRSCKNLIISDDEEVKAEELNPFSFKEFLRLKNQDQDQDQDQDPDQDRDQDQDQDRDQDQDQDQEHSESCSSSTFDPDVHKRFLSEPSMAPQEEDKDWGWGFQCVASSSSLLSEEETRFCSEPKGGDNEMSMTEPINSFRRRSDIQLKEDNMALRRTIRELQRRSDAKERRVQELSEELLQRRRQDEKEAEDLESMVHSVEQNLHLMTKRAMKAENNVSKLKAELQQLQVEVESLRSENDGLKAAESQVVMTMRQTALVASEYLNKMASHAHSSIRQLLGEAETLRLVSHLLRSIDKISEC
ncbi:endosome-associated-trafficking regulator 1 isoform X2 [Hippoglossus stenolepis]|uniref:endosome-associated-trafficking regulator 1 isoform X2 n=1 Tax=Hippoglossus stenolepis TaxID=195615 RepID=UPI00159C2180|nr:endosome-associated-trafficking regulator 1 isoform X2 [Hippoglossus stenolepis]